MHNTCCRKWNDTLRYIFECLIAALHNISVPRTLAHGCPARNVTFIKKSGCHLFRFEAMEITNEISADIDRKFTSTSFVRSVIRVYYAHITSSHHHLNAFVVHNVHMNITPFRLSPLNNKYPFPF